MIHTSTHPIKLFTSSLDIMPPTEEGRASSYSSIGDKKPVAITTPQLVKLSSSGEGRTSSKEMKGTPLLKTISTTTGFSTGNVMTSVLLTTAQFVARSSSEIKYVDNKTEFSPTQPDKTPTGPTAREEHVIRGDQDWQVSVYVVCALILGIIGFVAIMLIKSIRRDRLVV